MAMDYGSMQSTAESLLEDFGSTITLNHYTGESYNSTSMKTEKTYDTYTGHGVKLDYSSEAIGNSNNIVQAGDAKIICQFSIEPVEDKDQIDAGGVKFNIVQCSKVEPDSATVVIYTLQCRKVSI